jgi:hypothetical protein
MLSNIMFVLSSLRKNVYNLLSHPPMSCYALKYICLSE